ncbi:MAG: hypothetical protein HYS13_24620 [Planctomycetia bacterium]|nr:hypothetical protein [Planctomycetia bacterium]
MELLERQVARAHRRLTLQLFLRLLCWSWCATLAAAALFVTADWYWQWQVQPWIALLSALGGGLVFAVAWTFLRRADRLAAAIELDKRFGLKERVSSALSLAPEDRESPFGQALAEDALRRARNLHVSEHFGVRFGRWSLAPVLPAAAIVALVFLLPKPAVQASTATAEQIAAQKKKQNKAADNLKRKNDALKRKAEEKENLKELDEIFKNIEKGTEGLKNAADKKEALSKINDMMEEVQKKREALGSAEELKEQLKALKGMNDGPADKLSEALKKGDLQKAKDELEKLKQKLGDNTMSDEERKKLLNQLQQMQEKLDKMAQAQQAQKDALKKQIDQANASGNKEQAQKLQQQLDKMNQQSQQMAQMQQMAKKFGECAQCMKEGKTGEAMAKLQQLQGEMSDLQQQLEQMEALDDALDMLADAKGDMLDDLASELDMQGEGDGEGEEPGDGLGRGRGFGRRPEEATDGNKFVSEKVKGQQHKGSGVITGDAAGPNKKGVVLNEIKGAVESGKPDQSDPTVEIQLPKSYRAHAKKYFEAIREGK